jgi:hypothetical protein
MANANTVYKFGFNISQGLSNSSAVRIGFSPDINFANPSCNLTINGISTSSLCSSSGNILIINITASSNIAGGSQFNITVNGITNALYPQIYNFSL